MESRWEAEEAQKHDGLGLLAYASRLLGADHELVLWGGGNTSWKGETRDAFGKSHRTLWMKPSGAALKSIQPECFAPLRLDDLEPLVQRDAMDDAEMLRLCRHALIDPDAARPSIETLLHAFLPDLCVLHSHADALLAIGARVCDVLGDRVAYVPYRRPGFALSKEVAAVRARKSDLWGVVLLKHGLVTFGDDIGKAYARHLELVSLCEKAVPLPPLADAASAETARAWEWAPQLRGAAGGNRILLADLDDDVRAFVSDESLLRLTQRGPATPDHLLATKRTPCIVRRIEDIREYADAYRHYVDSRHRGELETLDPAPRVLLVPGVGMWTVGRTFEAAALTHEIYKQTMRILRRAGETWDPISEDEAFDAEYWPLERLKLQGRPPPPELEGKIAWISGAASGIGRAIARRFVAEGAHVALVDRDEEGVRALRDEFGVHRVRAVALSCDVTNEDAVAESFDKVCLAYGGLDIVVSNAGIAPVGALDELTLERWKASFDVNATAHFLVARSALGVFRAQGLGGAVVFNASKNVPAPGAGMAAYSAAKAAETQLARVFALEGAPLGVRVNILHPDAVFQDTKLWSEDVRRERAKAHGVPLEELEAFYQGRNLLNVPVRPEDVAEAALFFASDRSSRTTGATLAVDGGVKEAFPR